MSLKIMFKCYATNIYSKILGLLKKNRMFFKEISKIKKLMKKINFFYIMIYNLDCFNSIIMTLKKCMVVLIKYFFSKNCVISSFKIRYLLIRQQKK